VINEIYKDFDKAMQDYYEYHELEQCDIEKEVVEKVLEIEGEIEKD